MSKPIEYIETEEEKMPAMIPDEYKESFNNLLKTIKKSQ